VNSPKSEEKTGSIGVKSGLLKVYSGLLAIITQKANNRPVLFGRHWLGFRVR